MTPVMCLEASMLPVPAYPIAQCRRKFWLLRESRSAVGRMAYLLLEPNMVTRRERLLWSAQPVRR